MPFKCKDSREKKRARKKRARTELHVGSNKTKQHSLKLKAAEVQLSLLASSTGLQSLQRATVPACLVVHTHVNFRTSTRGAEKATRRYNIRIGAIKTRQHAEPCDRDFKLHSSFFNSESACRRRHGTRLPPQRRFNKTRQHTLNPGHQIDRRRNVPTGGSIPKPAFTEFGSAK